MKDTRAEGGGALTCKPLVINELHPRLINFHAEVGFSL